MSEVANSSSWFKAGNVPFSTKVKKKKKIVQLFRLLVFQAHSPLICRPENTIHQLMLNYHYYAVNANVISSNQARRCFLYFFLCLLLWVLREGLQEPLPGFVTRQRSSLPVIEELKKKISSHQQQLASQQPPVFPLSFPLWFSMATYSSHFLFLPHIRSADWFLEQSKFNNFNINWTCRCLFQVFLVFLLWFLMGEFAAVTSWFLTEESDWLLRLLTLDCKRFVL